MATAQIRSRSRSSAPKAAGAFSSAGAVVVPVVDDEVVVNEEHGRRRQQEGGGSPQEDEEAEMNSSSNTAAELRRGPWTVDEDLTLVNYIADNGEGRWNNLARAAGLKRTGKSCRLRWLNYLRPDVKRGNFSADEQLLILDLHTRWGNRWSKIAQHLPGRTDNEIKNYWRTRVQKHAKQLNCDANSKRFKDAMRYLWMPHLVDIAAATAAAAAEAADDDHHHHHLHLFHHHQLAQDAQHQQAAANDSLAYAADAQQQAALPPAGLGLAMAPTSSSDSLASESYDDVGGGLFADVRGAAAGEVLTTMNNGGGGDCWAAAHQEPIVSQQGLWPSSDHDHSVVQAAPPAAAAGGGGGQFQDPELSGWVQGFSDSITTDSFWALEEIWKMQ